jgi:hypothetical protein
MVPEPIRPGQSILFGRRARLHTLLARADEVIE